MGSDARNAATDDAAEPLLVCQMCRREVPERQILRMLGRSICLGCAAAWFEDDEE